MELEEKQFLEPGHKSPTECGEDQLSAPAWNMLPNLVLEHIYGYLDTSDRFAAGSTCSQWRDALDRQLNWRHVQVQVDNDYTHKCDPRMSIMQPTVLEMISQFGTYFRSLELVWPRGCLYPHVCSTRLNRKRHSEGACDFFQHLNRCQAELQEIVLTDWINNYKWRSRVKILRLFVIYLRSQNKLERLSMQNACFELNEVLQVLSALGRGSDSATKCIGLHHLDLRNAFSKRIPISSHAQYLKMFDRMTSLTSLFLDYNCICDNTLRALAKSNCATLTVLSVELRDLNLDSREPKITDGEWKKLAEVCPQLQVGLNFINIAHNKDIHHLLLASIPLYSFRLTCGRAWDQRTSREYRNTMYTLLSYYTNTLADVQFHMKNNVEEIDDLLLELVYKCKNLENFQFDGVIRSLDTVAELCAMQVNEDIKFKTMHVCPRNMIHSGCEALGDICYNYLHTLADMDVDFRIDNAPSVMMYT